MTNLIGKKRNKIKRLWDRINRSYTNILKIAHVTLENGVICGINFYFAKIALNKSDWASYKKYLSLRIKYAINIDSLSNEFEGSDSILPAAKKTLINNFPVDIRKLSIGNLEGLYSYYRYFGNFYLAQQLRTSLLEKYVHKQKESKFLSKDGVNAAIELGMHELALEFLESKKNILINSAYLISSKALLNFLLGSKSIAIQLWESQFCERDFNFKKLVDGKTVAIVGPAPPQSNLGEEIDGYDLIIRTNYTVGSNYPEDLYGSKTDISHYNHFRMATQLPKIVEVAKSLKSVVLKSERDYEVFSSNANGFDGIARDAFLAKDLFFQDSDPMAIQNILNDILRFSPSKIKLFCTNFYDSGSIYSDNYRARPLQISDIASSLRIHELFSCFTFAKNLYEKNIFLADGPSSCILMKTQYDYASSIQNLYGSYDLII